MFNFIKHATGFLINAASFGFVNFGRSKPWYVKVGFVALGLGLNLLINSVPAILFSLTFTAVLFTIAFGVSILKRGFDAACTRFAGILEMCSVFR